MKYGELQEPKPPRFPLFIDLRPSKNVNIQTLNTKFNDILDQKSNQNEQSHNKDSQQPNKQQNQTLKTAHSLLQMSMIQQGVKQLPHNMLANTEFIGQKQNFEGINNPSYINYAAAFQAGFNTNSINDIKKKKKELQDPTKAESENEDDTEPFASDLTYAHNLNLFKKLDDINPFKKLDKANYKIFQESQMYELLNTNFMSPLSLLGEELFAKTKQIIKKINKKAPKLDNAPDIYTDNNIKTFEINANYNSIEKNTETTAPQWENWDEETTAHYLLKRYADTKQYTKVIRQFSGKILDQERHINRIEEHKVAIDKNQLKLNEMTEKINKILKTTLTEINENPNIMNDPNVIETLKTQIEDTNEITKLIENSDISLSTENQEQFIFYKTQLDQLIDSTKSQKEDLANYLENKTLQKTKSWWDNIGKSLNQSGMLMPFGLMAESAEQVFKLSHLDLNSNSKKPAGKLNEKLIIDTTNHLIKNEFQKYKPTPKITAEKLMIDNINYGQKIFNILKNQKIINQNGEIINFDPNNMFQNFQLKSENENNRIRKILKKEIQGKSSLNNYDNTTINHHNREDIKLIDPNGNKWDLTTLIESIPSNQSGKETYNQAREVYNILFDILETMAGDNLKKEGKLEPKIPENNQPITIPIYPKAEWVEYNPEISITNDDTNTVETIAGWEKVEDLPLTITFKSKEKAQELFETIKTTILQLEPLVSSFSTQKTPEISNKGSHYKDGKIEETAIRVLIDNEGEYNKNGIITKESNSHRYDIDILAQKTFFQTSHWKQITTFLKSSIMLEIGTAIFSKSQINNLNKKRHKQKNEEYKERKTKWEEKKYEEKIDERKKEAKRKKTQKETLKRYDAKNKKRKIKLKKEIERSAKIKAKRRKESQRANQKKSKKQTNKKRA